MGFIYLDEEMRQEAAKKEKDLRRVIEKYTEWRKLHPEQPEGKAERFRDWWDFQRWKRQEEKEKRTQELLERLDRKMFEKQFEEQIAERIPPNIRETIRKLREAGQLPFREPASELGIIGAIKEAFKDVGVLVIFLVFVLVGSIYLGHRTMFYILSIILLSMILVNVDKFRRLLHMLTGGMARGIQSIRIF